MSKINNSFEIDGISRPTFVNTESNDDDRPSRNINMYSDSNRDVKMKIDTTIDSIIKDKNLILFEHRDLFRFYENLLKINHDELFCFFGKKFHF